MKIEGNAAVVTGGASGLGRAVVEALHAGGARVAALDLNHEALAGLEGREGLLPLSCDVTQADALAAALEQAGARHGVARLVVHCAGIAPAARIVGRQGPMALDAFRRVIDVNLVGSFNLLRLAAAAMQGQPPLEEDGERGLIVLTASIAAWEGQVGQAAYAASKAGVTGLVLPAARELAASGIRVCAIAPGVFETPMVGSMPDEVQRSLGAAVPFPSRLGRPSEYASLVMHMAGNRMINGCTWRLDGAHRMGAR